jgi:hypothetical protein
MFLEVIQYSLATVPGGNKYFLEKYQRILATLWQTSATSKVANTDTL